MGGDGESPAHVPCFPYRLGTHGTVWGFGLKTPVIAQIDRFPQRDERRKKEGIELVVLVVSGMGWRRREIFNNL